MTPIVSLKNINKVFRDGSGNSLTALKNIDLEIFDGEFFVILGPSGSGKSTLLRIIAGLEQDYEGEIKFGEPSVSKEISFVFQQFALLPWLTVYKNVELGLIARNVEEKKRRRIVNEKLTLLGLEKFASAKPKELSGGMRQRVGIARALATNPKILLMDEPFSELDSFTAEELRKELLKIWRGSKLTIVMVTHIISEALELADKIAVLTPLPGKIERVVNNNLPRPRDKRSTGFYKLEDGLYKLIRP